MIKSNIIAWANDLSENTGEGRLARDFLGKIFKHKPNSIIKIKTFNQEFILSNKGKSIKKVIYKNNFLNKYLTFLYGMVFLWKNYKKKILFINYLPLWNFFIFLLLPKKTILGPITGGVKSKSIESFESIIRNLLFPILYKISLFIINYKFKKVFFSTNLLNKYVSHNPKFFSEYIYNLFLVKQKKNSKKKFDLIFYNREYQSKENNLVKNIISNLNKNYKVCVVGDRYEKKNCTNYGYVSHKKIIRLIRDSKIAFGSSENILSLFAVDCFNSSVKIVYNKNSLSNSVLSKKNFISIDYNDPIQAASKINKELLFYKFRPDTFFINFLKKKKKDLNYFFSDYF